MKVEDKMVSAAARTRQTAIRSLIGGATNPVRLVLDLHHRRSGTALTARTTYWTISTLYNVLLDPPHLMMGPADVQLTL